MLASGLYHTPYKPNFDGTFDGEIVHSFDYKSTDLFKDKKVLIVGGGNSACDIAVDAVKSAESVHWSTRRGYHYLPKFLFGTPTDLVGERLRFPIPIKRFISRILTGISIGKPEDYGLEKPDHKLFEYFASDMECMHYPLEKFAEDLVVKVDGEVQLVFLFCWLAGRQARQ